MNRSSSSRNSKVPNVDESSGKASSSADTFGKSLHSPILSKPPVNSNPTSSSTAKTTPEVLVSFFPELAGDINQVSQLSNSSNHFIPESTSKTGYNTRKRSSQEAMEAAQESSVNGSNSSSKPQTIPGFVSKLYRMVDESTSNLIKWGPDGQTFVVTSPEDFSRQVLPLFFKHNNFSSFVRQLNMYGFHKVPHLQQGSMAASAIGNNESTIWEFSHVNFIRNSPESLVNVRRKLGKDEDSLISSPALSNISSNSNTRYPDDLAVNARHIRQELEFIQQQQTAIRTDLHSLQRDNQLLWNENLASRERHLQQQQVIDRILRFLASVFTADGKLLAGTSPNSISSVLQANLTNPSASSRSQQRPLLLGNISENDEDEIRRQVMELISGNDPAGLDVFNAPKIDLVHEQVPVTDNYINFNRIDDLENTTAGISQDISTVQDQLSSALKTKENGGSFDDLDFSSYLNCQSLE